MIRTEREYKSAVKRLQQEQSRLAAYQAELEASGLDKEAVERSMDPLLSFHLQFKEEVNYYERLKQGDPGALFNLHGLGRFLIGLRIARGWTQRKLAIQLKIRESQVSRDERNEYHGVSIERAARVLDVLGVRLEIEVKEPIPGTEADSELVHS